MKNKWQLKIDDLLTVFKTAKRLVEAINDELSGESLIYESTLGRIRSGKQTIIAHEMGQALLILHVRYIPIKDRDE